MKLWYNKGMEKDVGYTGLSFTGALTILFVGLKLGNVIDWSWWWVLSPLWLPVVIVLTLLVVILLVLGLLSLIEDRR